MTTKCTIKHVVNAPSSRIAELLRTTFGRAGFRIELVNDDLREMSAQLTKSERISGTVWNYEYHAFASWEAEFAGVRVDLEVTEEKNEWTLPNCETYCKEIMTGVVDRAAKLALAERTQAKPNRYGTAKWATAEDVKAAGYWQGYDDSRRFIISPGEDQEYVTLTPEDTNKHVLVCGPTGSGKTTAIFIPNLIERVRSSAIVTEATAGAEPPDLYSKTAGWRQAQGGQRIYYFNPDDLCSDRINPIDSVKGYADAQALSQLIIENTTSKNNYGDDVWPKSEANLLTILIAHAASQRENLGYIRRLLREGPDGLVPILAGSPVEEVRLEYKGFSNTARDGFKYGVIAGLMQRLGLWVNPRICALTEKTDINLETLPEQLFTFYLAVPAQKTHLKPVAALVFNFILEQALQRQFKYPLFLSLDEFTNFGMIPAIAQKLSIIRHKQISCVLGVQDFVQLQQVYGKDDALLMRSQPGCKVYFRPRTIDVVKGISEAAGMTTVYERKVTSSGQITEKESGRPLIDPGEVLAMDDKAMIVFTPATDPLKLPRFTWQDYVEGTSIKALPKLEIVIDERLVKECAEAKTLPPWQEEGEKKRQAEAGEKPSKGEPKQQKSRSSERTKPKGKPAAERTKEAEAAEAPKPRYIQAEQEPEPEPIPEPTPAPELKKPARRTGRFGEEAPD